MVDSVELVDEIAEVEQRTSLPEVTQTLNYRVGTDSI